MQNYQIIKKIYESANSLVYQAVQKQDNQPFILKILKENYPTASELTRYKQEYTITRSLNSDSIIKAYKLQRLDNTLTMVLEDFGGQSLKRLISQRQLSLKEFLHIAIKITVGLAAIHKANIIHKDINPSNIVYNFQTEQLKIIDFGISTQLAQEFVTACSPNQIEGTLAYIAPEQTGRMNRNVDYRSDFYSLGITFYELLTNQLPFNNNDPMELVHCHIAQVPKPIHELVPDCPVVVSHIVGKLLAKTPEERYQSAWGIQTDLETCLHQLQTNREISIFLLGSQDFSEKFSIPQKLYGRDKEVAQLLNAFERVSQGDTELFLISGYSGIGKTALVNEIYKPITRQRGKFIKGKFDQLQRDIPYFAISQAFQDLIDQVLSESEITLQAWKKKILEALGNNGQIIIDVIPELEKIIGKQPIVEPLGEAENQNRFNLFFQRFLNIFCQKEHPLVAFIDDLQWADLPSLNLIKQLISSSDLKYFLMLGAYRDNEVSSIHPLVNTLENIKQAKVPILEIALSPLKIKHINQLIADTLNCSTKVSQPIAKLIAKKTGGNPFFLTQLIYSLYQDNLLVFNPPQSSSICSEDNEQGCWQWDINHLEKISITENVVDLMIHKIKKLNHKTQNVIKLAACIGNQFNLETLAIINNKSQKITAKELQYALDEGLIIPLDNNYKLSLLWNLDELSNELLENDSELSTDISYVFLHDRVQQAAYSLIPQKDKKLIHLKIGRLLLKNIKKDKLQQDIFDIVNHLNESSNLITEKSEKDQLAKLNLQAGKKAKTSVAYQLSLIYFERGIKLLPVNSWEKDYDLAMELHLEKLESLFLNTMFEQVEPFAQIILQFSKFFYDTAKVYKILSLIFYIQLQPDKAIDYNRKALAELDVYMPASAEELQKSINQKQININVLLSKINVSNLVNLPITSDLKYLSVISILQNIISSTITTNYPLFLWVLLTQLELCLEYGNSPQSPIVYCYYGMVLCSSNENLDQGYIFGNLSLTLLKKNNFSTNESLVMFMYYGTIFHWKQSIRNCLAKESLIYAMHKGIDFGDYESSSYAAITLCLLSFFGGNNLEDVFQTYLKYQKLIIKNKQEYSILYIDMCFSVTKNLIDSNKKDFDLIIGETRQKESQLIEYWINSKNAYLSFIFFLSKLIIYYFMKKYINAYESALRAEQYKISCGAYVPSPQHNFYSSLAYLANYNNYDLSQQEKFLSKVTENQESMVIWAGHCTDNFQHKYDLVEAEKARVLGQNWQAEEFYEKAIQGAKKYEFLHEEALAYERASEFYFSLGREEIGKLYLRNAHHCYLRWGAKAKVKQLEEEYPQYLLGITNQRKSNKLSTTISTTGNDGEVLDLTTILKASQAISSEIDLENLLQKLIKIVIENAGAQKGCLILKQADQWVIEAQGIADRDEVIVLQSIPIDSVNTDNNLPILPIAIINYVARTQEPIVLNNAVSEGQFINDRYIIANQTKSILCTPLLNQGNLSGIVYLENNLTTEAFTPERIELLNILSAQAAISIDNSRLYQTLEQKVEERTKELSQTLEILKATQAELRFENDLLKSEESFATFDYQVGGSLSMDAPTYVVRAGDRYLYQALKRGEFCYILNPRQVGKSSLMVRMIDYLQREGFCCAPIDMTRIGSENITREQWYKGFCFELLRRFGLRNKINFKNWWQERADLSPVQKLSELIEDVLLTEVGVENGVPTKPLVIFIDEIDSVLNLDLSINDFFAFIRSCYNQRSLNPVYRRLTFALFGVTTPGDLMTDTQTTPFNIGQPIYLEGFKEHEAQPLLQGLAEKVSNPQTLLKEILNWTNGQPFLTQKICKLIRETSATIPVHDEAAWLQNLIQTQVIQNWESQDEPEHLKTIRDRVLKSKQSAQLLELYQQVLDQQEIAITDSSVERELLLSGLVIKKDGILKINNPIYQLIFNQSWLAQHLNLSPESTNPGF